MNVSEIRARVLRLRELAGGMGKELELWKADPGPLLPLELVTYRNALQDVLAGADLAAAVLETAVKRLEQLRLPGSLGGEG